MNAESTRTRCILCDTAITVTRNIAREEPTLLCRPCRQRPVAARKALREETVARIAAPALDTILLGYRRSNLKPLAAESEAVTRRRSTARFFQRRAAEAVEYSMRARARSRVTLVRAHLLVRHLDALLSDARALKGTRREMDPAR